MARPIDCFPDPEKLLQLEPEDVGALLLQYLNALTLPQIHRHNLFTPEGDIWKYAGTKRDDVLKAFAEGWAWLQYERLIAPVPGDSSLHNYFITRRGEQLRTSTDYSLFKQGALLAPRALDPVLAHKVVPLFLRGDYDIAIFQAYKEVEVRVRKACAAKGQPVADNLVGTYLMFKAFAVEDGPLTNKEVVVAEREAMRNLFAGAIGFFKNPVSHRDVKLAPLEASELIHFANYLLRIVDPPPPPD
jgi:uncharacterized protein (TIGR02391 family)